MGDIDNNRPEVPVYRKDRKLIQTAIGKTYQQILDFLVEELYGATYVNNGAIEQGLSRFVTQLQEDVAEHVNRGIRTAHEDGRRNQVEGVVNNMSAKELKEFTEEQASRLGIHRSTVNSAATSTRSAMVYNSFLDQLGDDPIRADIISFLMSHDRVNSDQKVQGLVIDTYSDILEATENTVPSIKKVVRDTVRDTLQLNALNGENYSSQAEQLKKRLEKGLTKKGIRGRIVKDGFVGIVDKAGRRWDVGTYSDMVVRTKLSQAYTDGVKQAGIELDMDLAVISDHGAEDDCSKWEGVVVSMNGKTPGFPTFNEAKATNEVFHPNCQHSAHLIRSVDELSSRDRKTFEKQLNNLGDYKKRMKRTRI